MSTKLFFISCSLLLSIITSPVFAAFSLGNYNHLSGVAYFFEKEWGVHDRQPKIVKVDFANQTREVIRDDGYYNSLSLNPKKNVLSFFDKEQKELIFIDLSNGNELMVVPAKVWGVVYWSDSGDIATYYDSVSGDILLIDLQKTFVRRISVSDLNPFFWSIEWNDSCGCFYYLIEIDSHVKEVISNLNAKTYRIQKDELKLVSTTSTSNRSPNGKYYYEATSVSEVGNQIALYSNKGDLLGEYVAASPVYYRTVTMWAEERFRVLVTAGEFDLKTGRLNNLLNRDWFWELGTQPGAPKQEYWDLAADPAGYVLMINNATGMYEVEDVSSGAVIKKYKNFW